MLFVVITTFCLFSCDVSRINETKKYLPGSDFAIHNVKIDGCEYIVIERYTAIGLIHKANCKNHK